MSTRGTCLLGNIAKQLVKSPSTLGGKIRLLGLLGYSVASVINPGLGAALRGSFDLLMQVLTIK